MIYKTREIGIYCGMWNSPIFLCEINHKINDHDLLLQRLDIRGKIKVLHGQNKKTEEAPLALFCLCTPFGPPSLLEIPHKEVMFKSKHKLDLGFVSMDHRGKEMLQYDDEEMSDIGGYDLVHHDDLAYVASAHQERKTFHLYESV